jgi:uncharacterized protein
MFSRCRLFPLLSLVALAFLAGCDHSEVDSVKVPKSIEDRFPVRVGDRTVQMQVAVFPAEMEHGLMFREAMGEDEGMIFVYERPQLMSFWMRNTTLPLDIGYFDSSGELKEVYPMYPRDERPVASRGRMQYALEMNQGWFARSGVTTGAKLDQAALAEALRARGLQPSRFGIH